MSTNVDLSLASKNLKNGSTQSLRWSSIRTACPSRRSPSPDLPTGSLENE